MNLNQKTLIWGLSMYSLGWLILIIKGMGIIEIFGWSLCFAGIFSLSTTIALRLNDDKLKLKKHPLVARPYTQ